MSSGVNPISIGKIPGVRSVNKKKDKGKRAFSLNDSIKTSNKTGFNQEINTENLYFLQTNSKDSDKEKDYNYGNNLLNLLSEYRKSMLFSKSSLKELNEIKENLKIYNISCTDKKLLDIIQEIETLASVELAKRGLI
jgi:hypothetical protein